MGGGVIRGDGCENKIIISIRINILNYIGFKTKSRKTINIKKIFFLILRNFNIFFCCFLQQQQKKTKTKKLNNKNN